MPGDQQACREEERWGRPSLQEIRAYDDYNERLAAQLQHARKEEDPGAQQSTAMMTPHGLNGALKG